MKLDPFVRDYRAYLNELAGVVDAPATRFYLDTSLLLWLVRLGAMARREFLTWCQGRSVKVPVWSAHEFHHHIVENTLGSNVQKLLGETQKKVDEFVRLAAERADEGVCRDKGYAGRQSFVSDVEQAFVKFREFAKVVGDDAGFGGAAQEVIDFVNAHVLGSDLSPIVEKLGEVGEFRYGHRIPPGFRDNKDENRFGDAVIWEEIQMDVKASNPTVPVDAVFISRDDKTDWVSAARMVAVDEKRKKANRDQDLDVIRPHPLLVHEFAAVSSNGRIYILQPGFLASVVDYASRATGSRNSVATWIAAAHRPDLLSELAGAGLAEEAASRLPAEAAQAASLGVQPTQPTGVAEPEPPLVEIMGSDVSGDIAGYTRALPREQERTIRDAQDELVAGNASPIKFGRLLAELALEGRAEVSDRILAIVEGLKSRLNPMSLQRLVLAIAASAYFDKYAELLKRPRQELRSIVVSLERDDSFRSVFVRLHAFLEEKGAELPYMPGSGRKKIPFKFEFLEGSPSPQIIRQVRVGDQTAMIDSVPESSDRNLSRLLGRAVSDGCSGKELRMLIAEQYFIPPDLLSDQLDKKKYLWLSGTGLVPIDTTSEGGLSATDDDEDIDRE